MFYRSILFSSLLSVSTASYAGLFVQGGLHVGGDDLATVSYVGGGNDSIEAGGLISLSLGYDGKVSDALMYKVSAGLKTDAVTAGNGEIEFRRFPLTAMIFNQAGEVNFGIGITRHVDVDFSTSGALGGGNVDFEDATGVVLQMDYMLNERGYLSLIYTQIDYEVSGFSGSINGNSLGILIGYRFGQ